MRESIEVCVLKRLLCLQDGPSLPPHMPRLATELSMHSASR